MLIKKKLYLPMYSYNFWITIIRLTHDEHCIQFPSILTQPKNVYRYL